MDPHRLAELRSLAYHRTIAARLGRQPDLLARARERVTQWRRQPVPHPWYVERWEAVLSGPLAEIVAVLVAPGEDGVELRQSTPFAGALSPQERWQLWASVRGQAEQVA